jgi:exo-beta-1,3-glucanase (GH17 family)
MSRYGRDSYHGEQDPLPWDDVNNNYLDPEDRDEYDDFAHERSRPHPNLPQTNVSLTPRGSIRTSYQNVKDSAQSSTRGAVTPPRQTYSPVMAPERADGQNSPTRPYRDDPSDSPSSRADSPTRIRPATAATLGGYEMVEAKSTDALEQLPETSSWLKEEQRARKKRKWIIIGIIVLALLGVIVGVVVYLVKFHHSSSSSSSSSNNGNSTDSTDGTDGTDTGSSNGRNGFGATSKDLKIDPSLKKIFDGMDYTPINTQYPACGSIQANVTADVAILSQLTTKIRLYGTDCDAATMVLDAIQSLKVDLTVFVGVWVDNNSTTLNRQLSATYDILKKYPVSLIDGIAVGNEVLYRQDLTEAELISLIQQVKANVTAMNLGKNIPVCTSDLGSNWTPQLSAAGDCVVLSFTLSVNEDGQYSSFFWRCRGYKCSKLDSTISR